MPKVKVWTVSDASVTAFLEELPAIRARLACTGAPPTAETLIDRAKVLHLAQHGALDDVTMPEWLVSALQQTLREAFQQLTTGRGPQARRAQAWRDAHIRVRRYVRVQTLIHRFADDGPPLSKANAYKVTEFEEVRVLGEPAPKGLDVKKPWTKYTGARVKWDCLQFERKNSPDELQRAIDARYADSAINWLVFAPRSDVDRETGQAAVRAAIRLAQTAG